ncbi:hypothetical protein Q3G72_009445 [Acer saccharum]|nr:hypothetical protein Q3G72_009445 [Acer saccharum]
MISLSDEMVRPSNKNVSFVSGTLLKWPLVVDQQPPLATDARTKLASFGNVNIVEEGISSSNDERGESSPPALNVGGANLGSSNKWRTSTNTREV